MMNMMSCQKWKSKTLLILLVLFSVGLTTVPTVYADGFTVSSVSTSNVISKNTDPTTVYYIINTQFNGGGQSITGTINPDQIKNAMNGKVYSKIPLSITVSSVNENVFYDVVNQGVPIYKYASQTYNAQENFLGIITEDPAACPPSVIWDITLGNSFFDHPLKRYCITKIQVGTMGVYDNPTIGFNAKITITAGSDSKQQTICSGSVTGCDGSSVSFGTIGSASWTGSLVTGDSPPNQNNFVAIKGTDTNQWRIVRRTNYDNYAQYPTTTNNALNSAQPLFSDYEDTLEGDNYIMNAITQINQAADSLLAEDTSFTSSPFTKDSNTGKVTVTLQRSLTSPNIVFRIRADWIGIVIPTGQPKIVSVNSDAFGSGETGSVNVQVQNVGDAAGTFSAQLVGCEPFVESTSAQSSRKTLQAGDVDNILIQVSGGSISDNLLKSCTVKVYDVNDPTIVTTSSVTLQLEKAKICIPDKVFADGNTIKKCNKDGSAILVVENCKYGVASDGKGSFICSQSTQTGSNTIENNGQLDNEILQFGVDAAQNVLIPIALGSLEGQLKLGSHAEQAAKNSRVAFPNVAASISKMILSKLGNTACVSGAAYVEAQTGGLTGGLAAAASYGVCTDFISKIING